MNIVKSLGPLGASGSAIGASALRGLKTFVASFRPVLFMNGLSPPGARLSSGGEKPPPREAGGDTVPEKAMGIPEELIVEAAGGFKESEGCGSGSSFKSPSLPPPLSSLKI
jgi:hypothetical protein